MPNDPLMLAFAEEGSQAGAVGLQSQPQIQPLL